MTEQNNVALRDRGAGTLGCTSAFGRDFIGHGRRDFPDFIGSGCRTANERSVIDKVDAGFCSGIVEGTMWSLQIAKLVCLPNGMTLGQGLKVLVKYMDDHPEELHEKTAELAARAFVKAWPCSHDSEKPADESFRKR